MKGDDVVEGPFGQRDKRILEFMQKRLVVLRQKVDGTRDCENVSETTFLKGHISTFPRAAHCERRCSLPLGSPTSWGNVVLGVLRPCTCPSRRATSLPSYMVPLGSPSL